MEALEKPGWQEGPDAQTTRLNSARGGQGRTAGAPRCLRPVEASQHATPHGHIRKSRVRNEGRPVARAAQADARAAGSPPSCVLRARGAAPPGSPGRRRPGAPASDRPDERQPTPALASRSSADAGGGGRTTLSHHQNATPLGCSRRHLAPESRETFGGTDGASRTRTGDLRVRSGGPSFTQMLYPRLGGFVVGHKEPAPRLKPSSGLEPETPPSPWRCWNRHLAASVLQASGFRSDATVFRLNARPQLKTASEPAFRRSGLSP